MGKGTTLRNVRIDDTLWSAAQELAKQRGETVSAVIREKLQEYLHQHRTGR
jgi:antitoxin component of RelBE/YafQ-DinJ toxin-antitoxin module